MPALAEVVEAQSERLSDGQEPLEMSSPEPEEPAVDGSLGAHQVGIALPVLGLVVTGGRDGCLAVSSADRSRPAHSSRSPWPPAPARASAR